jgi:uncharacterized protein (TIGR03118 family)
MVRTQPSRSTVFARVRPRLEPLEDRCLLSGNVLQTNLVSDLAGVAQVMDPNLVNPWGISESSTSAFWISDNNSGLATLYNVPGAANTPVSINPLVVNIPTPVSDTGGAPTGTVFNIDQTNGSFMLRNGRPAIFLFATEDGTIIGWNGGTQALVAMDNSGNNFTNPDPNQQTGAVYKGLAIATSDTPIFADDPDSTALIYATNFRTGQIDVFDSKFNQVQLPAGAFTDPNLPDGFAPFNIQELNGKLYVTYAKQNDTKHDDVAGPGNGFVDVYNLDGTPGLADGQVRLISRGPLNSPWGLVIAPQGFAGITAPNNDPVLLVGNFGDGFINAFDANSGTFLSKVKDPDGEPIQIDGLWALKVGNGNGGGLTDTVYFTAGLDHEQHGLFGALTTAAPGSPEGPAEAQRVQAALDVVQLDVQQIITDRTNGASKATVRQDVEQFETDLADLIRVERDSLRDFRQDASTHSRRRETSESAHQPGMEEILDKIFADFHGRG